MEILELFCNNLEDLPQISQQIITFAGEEKIWTIDGEMGAGKTTLIKALGEAFHIEDHISSPTFSIVNEYRSRSGDIFYHFDLYRINKESEAEDIGISEYLYSGHYCLIEWPARIENLLPEHFLEIRITPISITERTIQLIRHEK